MDLEHTEQPEACIHACARPRGLDAVHRHHLVQHLEEGAQQEVEGARRDIDAQRQMEGEVGSGVRRPAAARRGRLGGCKGDGARNLVGRRVVDERDVVMLPRPHTPHCGCSGLSEGRGEHGRRCACFDSAGVQQCRTR